MWAIVPWPGIEPWCPAWECGVLATGKPGNALQSPFWMCQVTCSMLLGTRRWVLGCKGHMILPTATANTRRAPTQSQLSNICGRNELGVFKDQVSLKCVSGHPAGGWDLALCYAFFFLKHTLPTLKGTKQNKTTNHERLLYWLCSGYSFWMFTPRLPRSHVPAVA